MARDSSGSQFRDKAIGRFLSNLKTSLSSHSRHAAAARRDSKLSSPGTDTTTPSTTYTKTPRATPPKKASRTRSLLSSSSSVAAATSPPQPEQQHSPTTATATAAAVLSRKPSIKRRESRAGMAKDEIQYLVQQTLEANGGTQGIKFSWRVARAFVLLKTQPAESFSICGIPYTAWPRTKIPTLGASPASCRVQEMFNVVLPGVGDKGKDVKLFVKIVPIHMWRQQWEAENQWNGEFATDGENFVMEAAALAFLHEYAPGIAPKLLGILEMSGGSGGTTTTTTTTTTTGTGGDSRHRGPRNVRRKDDSVTHMVVVSELYGEDLLDYLDRRDRIDQPLCDEEKRALQIGCVLLMRRLHNLGLAHLDFTPENILLGPDGLRLCDFAKATPLWSSRLRHVTPPDANNMGAAVYPFESCEPTVGKGAYMPPECWRIYWKLEAHKILRPLEDLGPLRSPGERVSYYFRVSSADVYMLGVVLFWIWSEGGVWKCSDPRQDEKYYHLMKSGMNFDLFRECRSWPPYLKDCLAKGLQPEPWKRATIDQLVEEAWCVQFLDEDEHGYLETYCNKAMLQPLYERSSKGR